MTCLAIAGARAVSAQAALQPPLARVLLLYQQQSDTRPMQEFGDALRAQLTREMNGRVDFYEEDLDLDRFAGRERPSQLARYFADKYRRFPLDVIVPVGGRALRFAIAELQPRFPDAPIVFALNAAPRTDVSTLPPKVTGRLALATRFSPTLEMARRLQPDAERVVVIGGAGPEDSASMAGALTAALTSRDALPVEVLRGLPLNELLRRTRDIPPRSIVIFANYRRDPEGRPFEPLDVVGTIARATSAPLYAQLRSFVGQGIVGGAVLHFGEEGMLTAQLVARVLRHPGALPPVESIEKKRFAADWRQLRAWGLPEDRLPPGTEVMFREPGFWARHGTVILIVGTVVVAESLLLWLLLVERRRRMRAQAAMEEEQRRAAEAQRQLVHMGRVALVGELTAMISHELRQPLAAIRLNAETGAMLARNGSSPGELDEIFTTIVADDRRADEVIQSVRRLLRKEGGFILSPVDLSTVCSDALFLLQREANERKIHLALAPVTTRSTVMGDPVQLQQVVINLIHNAIDAASTNPGERLVHVEMLAPDNAVELVVRDSGPGISREVEGRLFESFFTTKAGGLGLGLVIVRSIVERHGGRVSVGNHASGGAVFRVRLPAAPRETDAAARGVSAAPDDSYAAAAGTGPAGTSSLRPRSTRRFIPSSP